jgi:hypothetical protein
MEFKMTALLNGTIVTAVSKLAGLGEEGESVPFFIRGTTSNPTFVPDVKGMLKGPMGRQLGNLVKNRLTRKSAQNSQPNQPPTQNKSVMKKFTQLFHRKKKN